MYSKSPNRFTIFLWRFFFICFTPSLASVTLSDFIMVISNNTLWREFGSLEISFYCLRKWRRFLFDSLHDYFDIHWSVEKCQKNWKIEVPSYLPLYPQLNKGTLNLPKITEHSAERSAEQGMFGLSLSLLYVFVIF